MKVAIHQPHYFPWIGYFDKMAKVDIFVLADQVQLEKPSPMIRNRVLNDYGEIKYLTISGEMKDFLSKQYRDIKTNNIPDWKNGQLKAVKNYYRKAPAAKEIFPIFEDYLKNDYSTICAWTCASIELIRNLLNIKTPLFYQSHVGYDRTSKKSDLALAICKALEADIYFSGRGASVEYLDREKFAKNEVTIIFQDFKKLIYDQVNAREFVSGLSILDLLFNYGIEESRELFWKNVKDSNEFGE